VSSFLIYKKRRGGFMIAWIKKFFKIEERGSSIRIEILGGLTTFLAMAYILFVNPMILSVTGMPIAGLFLATALAAALGTLLMAFIGKMPVALAPGMGLNAFFAFTLVLGMGFSWQEGLAAIFVSGILYLIISLVGLRKLIVKSIPQSMKYAVAAGIGFFIAFIGLVNGGIIVGNPATLVSLGNLGDPTVLLAVFGILLTIVLLALKLRGAVFFGVVITGVVGIIAGLLGVLGMPAFGGIIGGTPSFEGLFGALFGSLIPIITSPVGWIAIISFLFVDFFDTAGTLMAVTGQMPFLTEKDIDRANIVDATSTVVGSVFGTSTTTSYIESLAGTGTGARTGLASVITGLMFLLSIFFYPLLSVITPAVTAAAMVIVGTMMASSIGKIKWDDWAVGLAAFITIITMILTYSISNGIGFGFITYIIAMVASKRWREVHWMFYIVGVMFLAHYIWF
jgi:AGZA family xanthine/uracil permease-like MFS transporter